MSSLVAAGVPATVRGQVARSLLPPCSDRPPLPQRPHSLGEIADHPLHFLFLSSPAENGSNLCLLRNFPRCLPWYIPLPIPQFSTSGSSPPEAGTPRWQQESLVHPLLPLCRLAWPSRGLRGPLHTVRAFANFTLFLMHQGSWIFKKYYRRSFGKEWNHFDLF